MVNSSSRRPMLIRIEVPTQSVLPLDSGTDGPYFPGLNSFARGSGVSCCAPPDEIDVYLTVPMSATNIQFFPPAEIGYSNRLYDNTTLNSVKWNMTQRSQVTLFYIDEAEQSTYQFSVIIGSILLGAAIPGVADWSKDISTANRPYFLYRRVRRKVLKAIRR